ncbi:hypothetical protein BDV96DRAFT_606180 [Lophiotrema nucula]|uniref:Uncharacterized protein n=1 Tax=Lophiotrema nucula TaxID=690887 RepID=A0A6A5YP48_9PLEO|nr:hypothetical protein BDV96DRAFT_606180 [Lophiotrema nucula]
MAPDLNSVSASPRIATTSATAPIATGAHTSTTPTVSRHSSTSASRRASQIYPMSPPPLPLASPGGSIPQQASSGGHGHPFPPLSPSISGHVPSVDATGVPMRHPRPLTAAELHLELEKEQEAVVNRLTRELSALRAHSASVASTASSTTSNVLLDATDPSIAHAGSLTGPTHPTSARRHRSSSSVSRTSYTGPATYSTGIPLTPATAGIPHTHHRYSVSSQPATSDPSSAQQARSASVVSTPRYEEVAHYKAELEDAKRENEVLKRRIRELERKIKADSDDQRGRRGAPNGHQSNGGTPTTVTAAEMNVSQ